MHIKAWSCASLIEYPQHIADVLYVGECNFRCPYCYNVDLVLRPHTLPDLDTAELLRQLTARRGFVDGVVVTGGEPTLQPDLPSFLAELRQTGMAIKLDTNGYCPDVLRRCLERGLLDYVAMDVKTSLHQYHRAAGIPVAPQRLQQSISLLLGSGLDHEFRTTVVPGLVGLDDVAAIARLIEGAKRYYLQCFRPLSTVAWGDSPPVGPPAAQLLREMAALAAPYVAEIGIRGLPHAETRPSSCL